MSPSPAPLTDPGDRLGVLLLGADHTVLAASTGLTDLLGAPLPPGERLPPDLLDHLPGTPLPARLTLRGPRGAVGCHAVALGGPAPVTLLLAEHDLARTILDALPLDVAVLDDQGRYVYVNPAAIQSADVRRTIIGLTDREHVTRRGHPTERAGVREQHFAQARASGECVSFTETFPIPSGPLTLRRTLPARA